MVFLYITSLSGKRINDFMRSALVVARNLGFNVHLACNTTMADENLWNADCERYGVTPHHIDFNRIPYHASNLKALRQLKNLMHDISPDIIHCNTPIGGISGRLVAPRESVVLYQAHGFHFWKGAPLTNWLLYYPVEKILAKKADIILTINHDDEALAQKAMHPRMGVRYVPGVGIRLRNAHGHFGRPSSFIRHKLGISDNATILLSVGELNDNKNHELIVEAMGMLAMKNLHLVILGEGQNAESIKEAAQALGVAPNVHLEGFRTDVDSYYYGADIFVMPSKREGLPVSLMEAMSCGLPCIASDIRGNRDLIENGRNGLLCELTASSFSTAIRTLVDDCALRCLYGKEASEAVQAYSFESSCTVMERVYRELVELANRR